MVLDNTIRSETTNLAYELLNQYSIGIEKERQYLKIAIQRMSDYSQSVEKKRKLNSLVTNNKTYFSSSKTKRSLSGYFYLNGNKRVLHNGRGSRFIHSRIRRVLRIRNKLLKQQDSYNVCGDCKIVGVCDGNLLKQMWGLNN